ncbi:MAG: TrmH family RNA methyltransferase [Bacteroidales bacterium]|jgi:tRNA G18 (ribose-2'-O)-methylase SpoU|nr:TrmH family RNA methyltransferase [Bacteroidales bacterium]
MKQLTLDDLCRIDVAKYRLAPKIPLVVVADDIRSASNVGSVFRTCDAFRVERLVLCGITPTPPTREIHKTALGATDSVEWAYEPRIETILADYKNKGYDVYALEQTDSSIMLDDLAVKAGQKAVLVLGNEVNGVSQSALDMVDYALEIPQSGTKHSLNVAVAAGIAIYAFFGRFPLVQ